MRLVIVIEAITLEERHLRKTLQSPSARRVAIDYLKMQFSEVR